jgi:hypothetical protein
MKETATKSIRPLISNQGIVASIFKLPMGCEYEYRPVDAVANARELLRRHVFAALGACVQAPLKQYSEDQPHRRNRMSGAEFMTAHTKEE